MKLAIIGGGWAGLAAAVRATAAGHQVTLYEMAPHWGGRARTATHGAGVSDNGQHILIGAYRDSLALMRQVGVDLPRVLRRQPLELRYPDGRGLRLPRGPALWAFAWGVATARGWSAADKAALLRTATGWALKGFRCDAHLSVAELCQGLPPRVRELLVLPLSVAALNTPAQHASAQVLLRVLRDALFGGAGAADLLLPTAPLGELFPEPAARWLSAQGAQLRLGQRVQALEARAPGLLGWQVDGEVYAGVVLACSAHEAARLAAPAAPAWAEAAARFEYEPIATVYLRCAGATLPSPMLALAEGPEAPAQFAFDHGALRQQPGLITLVVSGARAWVEAGREALLEAARRQLGQAIGRPAAELEVLQLTIERRATFRCTPGLQRPAAQVAERLLAAGDYIAGPYPATLEGAVRAGLAAADSFSPSPG